MSFRFDMGAVVRSQILSAFGPEPVVDGRRIDANETAVFARQLEHIMARTFDIELVDTKARSLFPVNTEVPTGAESHTYSQFEGFGKAKIIHNYATDFPSAEIRGKQFTGGVKGIGSSYQYTVQDLRAASMAGLDLAGRKANAARRAIEEELEEIAAVGNADYNLGGFTNAPDIASVTKGTQTSGTTWAMATPLEVLEDVQNLCKAVFTASKGKRQADTLLVGTAGYAKLAYTRLDTFSNQTLLTYVLANVPGLKSIEHWARLDTASGSSKERIMAYVRDPDVVELFIPQEFEQFAPQLVGMAFKVNCHMRTGGVAVRQPKLVTYMDGTQP